MTRLPPIRWRIETLARPPGGRCAPPPLAQRRKIRGQQDPVLGLLDVLRKLGQEGLPARIIRELLAAACPVLEIGIGPEMGHMAECPDLGREVADQLAEDRLLDRQPLLAHELQIAAHASVADAVDAFLDDHACCSSLPSPRKSRISPATCAGASV